MSVFTLVNMQIHAAEKTVQGDSADLLQEQPLCTPPRYCVCGVLLQPCVNVRSAPKQRCTKRCNLLKLC